MTAPLTYRGAGVDTAAKARLLEALGVAISETFTPAVGPWGGFAGTIGLPAGTGRIAVTIDGVGTKTVLARRLRQNRTIGADVVAHCANDLAAGGARPLCFADYVALPRLDERLLTDLLGGMLEMCVRLSIPLIGGETAEMGDVYRDDAYDVAGAMVGVVTHDLGPQHVRPGDRIVGLASSGLHTNGYSLARRLTERLDLTRHDDRLGATIGEALLAPHRCYAPAIAALAGTVAVHAAAHITGGGLPGNLVRALPPGLRAHLVADWPRPPIFDFLHQLGPVDEDEMRRTFNLGIGMAVLVGDEDADRALNILREAGEPASLIGEVAAGERGVAFT